MFRKFEIGASAFLDPVLHAALGSEFRGALAENYVMQALRANEVKTYYWMPNDKVGQGEVDFVFQTPLAQVIPIEVKSARNVRARSLEKLVSEERSPYAIILPESNFGKGVVKNTDCKLQRMPLYAAFCIENA